MEPALTDRGALESAEGPPHIELAQGRSWVVDKRIGERRWFGDDTLKCAAEQGAIVPQ